MAALKAGLGLQDESFLAVPQLFLIGDELQATCAQAPLANIQIVGDQALAFEAYGPVENQIDSFAEELKTKLTGIGYTVHFLPGAEQYVRNQAGVHCASNLVPNLQTGGTPWWK